MATEMNNSARLVSSGSREGQKLATERREVANVRSMRNRMQTSATHEEESANLKENAKAMAVRGGMLLFWLVAGIAIAKDLIDVFSALLDLLGTGLTATVVGAPVGMPIVIFSEIIDKTSGILIDFTLVAYFGYIGGGFALRLVVMSIGGMIDMIPVINVLPLTTVSFFAAYLIGRGMKKAVQIAESNAVKNIASTGRVMSSAGARVGKVLKYIGV